MQDGPQDPFTIVIGEPLEHTEQHRNGRWRKIMLPKFIEPLHDFVFTSLGGADQHIKGEIPAEHSDGWLSVPAVSVTASSSTMPDSGADPGPWVTIT